VALDVLGADDHAATAQGALRKPGQEVTQLRRPDRAAAHRAARPGTAVNEKGQQRAAEILRAARAVLVEEGYAAMTTRKIAERVGIRQSNVQYYFPAKADLVRALFQQAIADDLRVLARQPAQSKATPLRRMLATIDMFLERHHDVEQQRFLRELWALAAHDSRPAGWPAGDAKGRRDGRGPSREGPSSFL
jgi:AcrR family transcriptional regulator